VGEASEQEKGGGEQRRKEGSTSLSGKKIFFTGLLKKLFRVVSHQGKPEQKEGGRKAITDTHTGKKEVYVKAHSSHKSR